MSQVMNKISNSSNAVLANYTSNGDIKLLYLGKIIYIQAAQYGSTVA